MSGRPDVLIVGAGSVGLPLAYYLAARGLSVTVVDGEASWGRGQNRAAIGGIRATFSDPAKIRVCSESLRIVSSFREEYGIDVEWRRGGYLFVAYDAEREAGFRRLLEAQRAWGLDIGWIGPERAAALAPGIEEEGLRGGTFSPGDGYASPLKLATAYHKLALDLGVEFLFGERVVGLDLEGGRVAAMRTTKAVRSAGLYVNAAGAQAAELAAMAGVEAPVRPDCHEAGITEPVARFMEPMLVDTRTDAESGTCYFYQAATGQVVFCVTPNPLAWGCDADSTSGFLPLVARRMLALYPRLGGLRVRRTWRGMYPMTPDGQPIVGYSRVAENYLMAIGMCGQGFMIGPGLGSMLAASIAGGDRGELGMVLDQLSPYRDFVGAELLK
jgi:sarcosine oxidase, subunit beta